MIKPNEIVKDGKSDYRIVLPKIATACEKFAARELQSYLQKSTGAKLPVVTDEGQTRGKTFVLGRGNNLHVTIGWPVRWDKLGKEGVWIQSVGTDVLLAGSPERGVLYAVYIFLERCLGVRFFAPDETFIPRRHDFVLPYTDVKQIPYFSHREHYAVESLDPRFSARLRLNRTSSLTTELGGYETFSSYRGHTFALVANPTELFATHPEYFSMVDGKRIFEHTQLCLSNPEVLKRAIAAVRRWMASEPENRIFSLSQNDWGNPCQCPECEKLNREEGYSGTLIHFVNQVADAVYDEFPQNLVETFAYQYTRTPPKTIRCAKNVSIRLCTIECCFAHPISECSERQAFNNPSMYEDIKGWARSCERLYIWDYTTDFWQYLMPFDNLFAIKKNLQTYRDHNVKGLFMQGNIASRGAFSEIKAYLISKLMWNPDDDDRKLLSEFLTGYYGLAGTAIRRYIDLLHEQTEKVGVHFGCFEYPHRQYFTTEFMAEAERIFDEAERLADSDKILDRVRCCRLQIDYLRLFQFREDEPKNRERLDRFLDKMKKYDIRWLEECRPATITMEKFMNGEFMDEQCNVLPQPGDYVGVKYKG